MEAIELPIGPLNCLKNTFVRPKQWYSQQCSQTGPFLPPLPLYMKISAVATTRKNNYVSDLRTWSAATGKTFLIKAGT
jgi:hypothetical protein